MECVLGRKGLVGSGESCAGRLVICFRLFWFEELFHACRNSGCGAERFGFRAVGAAWSEQYLL